MIHVSGPRRRAVHVPFAYFGIAAFLGAVAVSVLAREGLSGPPVWCGLATLAVLAYAVHTTRTVRREGDEIVVRSVMKRDVFDARRAAFGVSVVYGSRSGPTYTVYLTQAGRRAEIGAYGSRRALAAHRDLSETFLEIREGSRAPARVSTAREIEAWIAQEDAAKATIDAYYQSPAWKRLPWIIGLGLLLYLLGMGAFIHFRGHP